MIVGGDLGAIQSDVFLSARFAHNSKGEPGTFTLVKGNSPLKTGKTHGCLSIASIGGSDQREEGGVLIDRDDLSVAKSPANGREIEPERLNLSEKIT